MKKILLATPQIFLWTLLLLMSQACQKKYDMIDPPFITDTDDLDEEVIVPEDLDCYYVTPNGKGNLDGSSWNNAMSAEFFRNLISSDNDEEKTISNAEKLDGKYIYLTSGEYEIVKNNTGVKIDYTACDFPVELFIEGGYDPASTGTDLTRRDTKKHITSFIRNIESKAGNSSNSMFELGSQMKLSFDGCTFDGKYNLSEEGSVRAFFPNGDNTSLHLKNCTLKNFNVKQANTTRGGAMFLNKGKVYLTNVEAHNNIAGDRGGAFIIANSNGLLFMNGCTLYENYVTGMWSTAIHTGGKAIMCMNNTTIWGAPGNNNRSITINGDGYFLFANTTIIGNDKNNYGVLRSPSYAALLVNSLVSKGKGIRTIYRDGATCVSHGYNVYQAADTGWGAIETDTDYSSIELPEPKLTDGGLYQWEVVKGSIGSFATKQTVIEAVKTFSIGENTIGLDFVKWCGEDSFGVDARGTTRNENKGSSPNCVGFVMQSEQ